jgi:hypothetical protein
MSETENSVGKDDVNKLMLDSLSKGVDSLNNHHYKDGEDTKKYFGIEVDSAIANMIEVGYNTFIGSATKLLTPKTYATVLKYGKGHLDAPTLNRVAAGTSFVVNTGIYALPSISEAYELWNKQHDALNDKVRQLAPLLDEIKGRHGVAAYHAVRVSDNEMIAHDRWRTAKINHTKLTNLIIPAIAKIAPNVWFHEKDTLQALQSGKHLDAVKQEHLFSKVAEEHGETIAQVASTGAEPLDANDVTHEHVEQWKNDPRVKGAIKKTQDAQARSNSKNEGFQLDGFAGVFGSNAALTTIANKLVESSTRRLKRTFTSDYTALDMVLNLQGQLGNEPTPHSFQLPNRGKSVSLEMYVADIMMQHQRDMANMNPDYTEIRDALKENVIAAAKPLAAALAKGDIGALSLVHYIGGGKIIRNKGRLIATSDEVEAMIEHGAGKTEQRLSVDPKDFWSDAPYNAQEGKEAFAALEGEERQIAIALIPHEVRKQFGISDKESKEADASCAKEMDAHMAEAILGAHALGDKMLRELGLANPEIKAIAAAAQKIEEEGVGAVKGLKSSAAHPNGVDRLLLAIAVGSEVKGEKEHFGTLIKHGRKKMQEIAANDDEHADNDNHSHRDRESRRRGHADEAEAYRE